MISVFPSVLPESCWNSSSHCAITGSFRILSRSFTVQSILRCYIVLGTENDVKYITNEVNIERVEIVFLLLVSELHVKRSNAEVVAVVLSEGEKEHCTVTKAPV
jgi:hypothetical protein